MHCLHNIISLLPSKVQLCQSPWNFQIDDLNRTINNLFAEQIVPNQTAPLGAVWSGSNLFADTFPD